MCAITEVPNLIVCGTNTNAQHKDRNSITFSLATHKILRSPNLSQIPKDAHPHTIDEPGNSLVHADEGGNGREGTALLREVRDKRGTKGEDGLPLAAADQNTVSVFSRLTAIIPSFHLHHYITQHQPEHYWIPY